MLLEEATESLSFLSRGEEIVNDDIWSLYIQICFWLVP